MSRLHSDLHNLTDNFIAAILSALRDAPLAEVMDHVPGPIGPSRRNPPAEGRTTILRQRGQIQEQKDAILRAASLLPAGFRRADVMKQTNSETDLSRALSLLVAEGKLRREGDRNRARYSVV